MNNKVTVKVPATTSNLGPGFDCLGMTLDLWNTFHAKLGSEDFTITGDDGKDFTKGKDNLVHQAASILYKSLEQPFPSLSISCDQNVPPKRGLGSSATAILAGLIIANALTGEHFNNQEILEKANEIEGHPDNVTSALLGGCNISVIDNGRLLTSRIEIPENLMAVVFVPDSSMSTEKSRSVLPEKISKKAYIHNLSRIALLVNSLSTGNLDNLKVATEDKYHQPPRESIFPQMKPIFRAAIQGGAFGVFLSGSGSSILALTNGREMSIGYEMADAANKHGIAGKPIILKPTKLGAHIID